MFLKTLRSLRHTLALRLTLWYAGIFAASSILAFTLVYASVVAVVQERTDEDLEEDIEEFASLMQSGGLERVKAEITADTEGAGASQTFFRLWAPDGRELWPRTCRRGRDWANRYKSWQKLTAPMSRYWQPSRCRGARTKCASSMEPSRPVWSLRSASRWKKMRSL